MDRPGPARGVPPPEGAAKFPAARTRFLSASVTGLRWKVSAPSQRGRSAGLFEGTSPWSSLRERQGRYPGVGGGSREPDARVKRSDGRAAADGAPRAPGRPLCCRSGPPATFPSGRLLPRRTVHILGATFGWNECLSLSESFLYASR